MSQTTPPAANNSPLTTPSTSCYKPLDLFPSRLLPLTRRAYAHVRTPEGRLQAQPVLQPIIAAAAAPACYYALDVILARHHEKGVIRYLATPALPGNEQGLEPGSLCLVKCGPPVVIKAVPQPDKAATSVVDNPLTEIAALQHLMQHQQNFPHPHIIPLLDSMQDQDYIYLVLPYLPGGDLYTRMENNLGKGLPEALARCYLHQICEGLLFMKQTSGIAHHNLSLKNIMFGAQDTVKVIDLGMCLRVPTLSTTDDNNTLPSSSSCSLQSRPLYLAPQPCSGKRGYVAPEIVHEEPFDPFAADIWSLGVCLYAMLSGRPLYNSPEDHAYKIIGSGGIHHVLDSYENYGISLSPCAKDLVTRMLQAEPDKRVTLEEIMDHPFLFSFNQREGPVRAA